MTGSKTTGAIALIVAGMGFAAPAEAVDVIDQRQENAGTFSGYSFGTPTQGWSFTQTFRPTATTLSGVGIRFRGVDPDAARDPDEWFQLAVTDGAQTLSPIAPDFAIDADGWVTSFWAPVAVVPGDSYTIRFGVFGGSQSPPYLLYVATDDRYAGGRLTDQFFFTDANGDPQTASDVYSGNGDFDAVFRTYAVSGAVPEPSGWALFIAGFGLVGTALRRRLALPDAIA